MTRKVRVRFAPSPTGPLHIGGVRTALYNYLFAKKQKGVFILRIEDTDQTRFVKGAEDYIRESLEWLGINYDEGPGIEGPHSPYRQSERKAQYAAYAEKLVSTGHAYYAFDTPEELDAMRERMTKQGAPSPKYNYITREYMKNSLTLSSDEVQKLKDAGTPYVIRLNVPRQEEIRVPDEIRGWVTFHSNQLDDKVLLKKDGMPTYHLANVVDDKEMEITHVIRGEEWLPSAPAHQLLYEAFGWDVPVFAHLPLILKPDGTGKLSKRDGDRLGFPVYPLNWTDPVSGEKASGFREAGYLPEAVQNLLAMLGWNPGTEQEIFTKDELIKAFDLKKVGKSGARFDPSKARWYNQQFLRKMDDSELAKAFLPILHDEDLEPSIDYVTQVCGLIKEKASFVQDFKDLGMYFFQKPTEYDEKVVRKKWKDDTPGFFKRLSEKLQQSNSFDANTLEQLFQETAEENEAGTGKFMQPFRLILSGQASGPALFQVAEILGREEVLERINIALNEIPQIVSS